MATDPKNKDETFGVGELTDEKLEEVAAGLAANLKDMGGEGADVKPARSESAGGLDQA